MRDSISPIDNPIAQGPSTSTPTPRPIKLAENHEISGELQGFEEVARGILQVQIGSYAVLLPMSLGPQLKELLGQRIGVTLMGRYAIRRIPDIQSIHGDGGL